MIDHKNTKPLYEQLEEEIKTKISKKIYKPGDRILSEPKLCKEYNVSLITVRKALYNLVHEGILFRRQGQGTFVNKDIVKSDYNTYALFIYAKGHMYESQSHILFQEIQKHGYSSRIVDLSGPKENRETIVREVINSKPRAIIIDGAFFDFPFTILDNMKDKIMNLCFINWYEREYRFPGLYVLSDARHGSYLATKHLLDLGHKKILLMVPKIHLLGRPEFKYTQIFDVIEGYKKALMEYGVPEEEKVAYQVNDVVKDKRQLIEIFTAVDRPTAVFAFADYWTRVVFDMAKEKGLKIPDDLAVVGYFNTPWTDMLEVPLTSVSIGEEAIVRIAVEKLASGIEYHRGLPETIYIKPELVIRKSCGSTLSGEMG